MTQLSDLYSGAKAVTWTIETANCNAVSGEGIFANTTGGTFTNVPGVVLWGRTHPAVFGHKSNVNMIAIDSCPELPCMRPRAAGGDVMLKNGELVNWSCEERICMRQLSSEKVAGEVLKLVGV